ncbi:hypothetical protein IGI37_001315 [Enterococcus sp. AZ194]|uniref:hypothetical protein n=1 Tax=Enterococcus sp. AZ194 TaxID=2774629 RepID=UPI003F29C7EE
MKNKYKILVCLLIGLGGLGIWFFSDSSKNTNQAQSLSVEITGTISDKKAAESAFTVLKKNIQAVNDKDIDAYLSTIVPSSREETKKEMTPFFEKYSLKNELLSFEVKKQDNDHMLIEAQQKSQNLGKEKYRSHIAVANHTFVKEGGEWLIQETVITDTKFIQ